jgi:hypothetical protein
MEPAGPGYDVQELWYLLLRREWTCLAVVSPDSVRNTWRLATSLAEMGTRHGRVVTAINGLEIDLERTAAITHQVAPRERPASGDDARFVVAIDSPLDNPFAIGVLAACDGVVLLLELGVSSLPRVRRMIEVIGRDQIVGAVLAEG